MKIPYLLLPISLVAYLPAQAQVPENELGKQLAHCAGVFSMVRAAPTSFALAVSKSEGETLGQISMLGAYVLLQPEPGKAEVKSRLEELQSRLKEQSSKSAFEELLNLEAKKCAPIALDNFPALKPRITKMLEEKK